MGYQQYGIDPILVERVKFKLKDPELKERIKMLFMGVTKEELQDRAKVMRLLGAAADILGEKLAGNQANQMADFVMSMKIDPSNTFHLIKLWTMLR